LNVERRIRMSLRSAIFFNEILAFVFVFHSTFDVQSVQRSMFIFFSHPGARNNLALICEAHKFLYPASGDNGPAIFALISVKVVSRYEIADPLN